MKLAIEPLIASNLSHMLRCLQLLSKSYPLLRIDRQDNGVHTLYATGELFFDVFLAQIRLWLKDDQEIRTSTIPSVVFNETVSQRSLFKCSANISEKYQIKMICEPLDHQIVTDFQALLPLPSLAHNSAYFQQRYQFDEITSRSIWSYGIADQNINLLIDYTLQSDKQLLYQVKDSIIYGYQWAIQQGPLCHEAISNCQFKITDFKPLEQNKLSLLNKLSWFNKLRLVN